MLKYFFLFIQMQRKNNFTFFLSLRFCMMKQKCPAALSDWCCCEREGRFCDLARAVWVCLCLPTSYQLLVLAMSCVAVPSSRCLCRDSRCPPGKEVPQMAPLCDFIP